MVAEYRRGCGGRCIVASNGVCGRGVVVVYKQRMAMRIEDRQMDRQGRGGMGGVE